MSNALSVVDFIFEIISAVFNMITADLLLSTFFMLMVLGFVATLMSAIKGKD